MDDIFCKAGIVDLNEKLVVMIDMSTLVDTMTAEISAQCFISGLEQFALQ